MLAFLVVGAVVALGAIATTRSYNRFVQQRQLIDNAWSNVDTELTRRHDLVPNLVEVVKGYAAHERSTLESVITARAAAVAASGTGTAQAGPENDLAQGVRRLLALIESYPDLRAAEHFLELQAELSRTENRIQAARRIYNGNVREYNQRTETVPSVLIARAFGFVASPYFEVDPIVHDTGAPSAGLSGGAGARSSASRHN
jgi:LemA protein